MEEEPKGKRGGRRPGAGRPRNDTEIVTFRAPGYMARLIASQPNKTNFIKSCINNTIKSFPDLSSIGDVISATEVKDIKLPVFDVDVVAGFPIPLDNDEKAQNIELLRMLCPYPESCYLIHVKGDSMYESGIYSGDIVIVDKSNRNPSPSEVALCELNGEYTLKRFEKRDGKGWLVPANPEFPEIEIKESDDFSIWGTVTYVIHKPRN